MLADILAGLRERYIGLQLWVLLGYLVIDACGFGLGIFSHIANRPFTNTGKFHIGNLFVGAPPPGPNRLTFSERGAVKARIATTFGTAPPKTTHLAEMLWLFRPKNVLCVWKPDNLAMDAKDCNELANAHPYYLALLAAMHPKTEQLLYQATTGYKGDHVAATFFLGKNGKPKILIDLTGVNGAIWNRKLGFKMKAWSGQGVAEVSLKGTEVGPGMFLIDDPGELTRRDATCAQKHCFARLLLSGYNFEGYRDAATRVLSTDNIGDLIIDSDLERRFALYAALIGKPTPAPKMKLDMSYKPEKTAVGQYHIVHLKRDVDAVMGQGTTDRALFSPMGYLVPFARISAFTLDGKPHLIWDTGTPYRSLGTDNFVFHWKRGTALEPVTPIGYSGGVWVLPVPPDKSKMPMLVVHKSIEPTGKPWSWFSDYKAVLAPLSKQ